MLAGHLGLQGQSRDQNTWERRTIPRRQKQKEPEPCRPLARPCIPVLLPDVRVG